MMAPAKSRPRLSRAVTRDLCWNAALALSEFTAVELAEAADLSLHQVNNFAGVWIREKLIERLEAGPAGLARFRIVNVDEARPSLATVQSPVANMWTAMRGLRSFSPRDIAAHASTDKVTVSIDVAQSYCQMLVRASYLRVMDKAIPGRRDAVYRLIQNTGPRPPVERRIRAVLDENLQKIVHIAGYAP